MQYYLATISLLLGLVVGSFLNVVVYRLPRRESLVRPGSRCPGCGTAIRWYDNIPVASWLVLGGRCRSCHVRIPVRYLLVEAITGVTFLGAFWKVGLSAALPAAWGLIAVVVALVFIQHDHLVILDRIALPAVIMALGLSIGLDPRNSWQHVAACAGAGFFGLLLWPMFGGHLRFAEAKIGAVAGAVLGSHVLVALPLAFVMASVAGLSLVLLNNHRGKVSVVPAPSLGLGAIVGVLFGQSAFHVYANAHL